MCVCVDDDTAAAAAMSKPKNVYDGKIAGLYDLGDTLGRGHFAVVKLARHVFTGEKVAVKVIDKTKLDEVSRAHLFQEVRCMKLVQHPNVVRLYEVIDTQTKLYLILELGDGGDMYDYIMKHEKGLEEETARKYFNQIVHAISYCHRLHVVHRDLKPENVVFFEKLGMVKLTDFGFSNRFCPGQKLETSCGSLAYSAPEILLGDSYDAPAVDVWSLGVILYMLVCGHAPFQEANDSETLTMIMDCKYTIPSHVSQDCARLIQKMLIRDPEKRATLEEITTDPWLTLDCPALNTNCLPLVSRDHLSEEDHTHILQKMANGNIATQEEILGALDKNAYNHITATYFLLAERKLRALRQEQAKVLNASHVSDLSALAISPRSSTKVCPQNEECLPRTVESLLSPQESRRTLGSQVTCNLGSLQKCHCCTCATAIIDSPPLSLVENVSKFPCTTKLCSSKSIMTKNKTVEGCKAKHASFVADCDNSAGDIDATLVESSSTINLPRNCAQTTGPTNLPQSFSVNKFKPVISPNNRKLHSVRSSPQLTLNEIYEEAESDGEAVIQSKFIPSHAVSTTRVLQSHQSVASPAVLRKYEQRRRYAKARTASCSSSDASDDDSDTRKRKAEKLKRMPGWHDGRWNEDDDDDDHDLGGAGPKGGSSSGDKSSSSSGGGGDSHGTSGGQQGPTKDSPPSASHERQSSSPERRRPVDGCPSNCVIEECANKHDVSSSKGPVAKHSRSGCTSEKYVHSWPPFTSTPSSSSLVTPATFVCRGNTETASPPSSPLCSPNITSLRQSKTLNLLNRCVSPTTSLLGSPVLDVGDKENHYSIRHGSPLHFLNFKRVGRYRSPAHAASSVAMIPQYSVAQLNQETNCKQQQHQQGLYRLFKHVPHIGSKRWDINRNGLNISQAAAGSPHLSPHYGLELHVSSSGTPKLSSSHSKCCSLC